MIELSYERLTVLRNQHIYYFKAHEMYFKNLIIVILITIAVVGIQLFLYTPSGKRWLKSLDD